MRIGWIGLGKIGTPMVKRLLAGGVSVTVYVRGAGLDEVRAAGGAAECADYVELAKRSDVLFLCLYNDAQVRNVLFAQGTLAALRPGSTLVIHTTGSPALVHEIRKEAATGTAIIDACFSGGPGDIAAGKLTLMIGGEPKDVEAAKPLLRHYAEHVHHVGPLGSGQTLKLLNNLLFATNMMNAARILNLAERQGFSAPAVVQILNTCSSDSYALRLFNRPLPVAAILQNTRPYLEKDVTTALAAMAESGVDVNSFAATADFFQVD